jgi:hypothetical protein
VGVCVERWGMVGYCGVFKMLCGYFGLDLRFKHKKSHSLFGMAFGVLGVWV